jgi:adenylate cyclase
MAKKKDKPTGKSKIKHRRIIILIGIAATLFSILITSQTWIFKTLEDRSVDWRFKMRGTIPVTAPVIIVSIDDESFSKMPERWTWPRKFYGRAIDNLKKWGAKVIAFDMVYSEPTSSNPKEDDAFAASLKKAGNVVIGMMFTFSSNDKIDTATLDLPIEKLRGSAKAVGLVHHVFDSDTHIRKSYVRLDYQDKKYYSLMLQTLGVYYDILDKDKKMVNDRLVWGPLNLPLYNGNQFFVNFAGKPGTVPSIPFYKVYYGEDIKPEMFKDKIVLIGATSDILHDVFITPFSESGYMMPGVEIHANVLNTIFTNSFMKEMDSLSGFILVLLIGILTSFLIFAIPTLQGLLVIAAEMVLYFIFARYFFDKHNYIVNFVNPIFTMVFCYLSMSTYKVTVEESEKRKIKDTFSRYVSANLVDELINQEIKLGGEKKEISILFSDIRGFTSMSEKMQPEEVVHILNEYLTDMTDVIFKNKGTLDKFIGDAVMALFGTPSYYKDHSLRAVKTAFMMIGKLNQLNEKWKSEGKSPLRIGIGINTGEVVAGNMGSLKRMEYTVIGDSVNLAARLESLNKDLGTEILISSSTYELVKEFVKVKKFTGIKVKGKEEELTVYEVLELNQL